MIEPEPEELTSILNFVNLDPWDQDKSIQTMVIMFPYTCKYIDRAIETNPICTEVRFTMAKVSIINWKDKIFNFRDAAKQFPGPFNWAMRKMDEVFGEYKFRFVEYAKPEHFIVLWMLTGICYLKNKSRSIGDG